MTTEDHTDAIAEGERQIASGAPFVTLEAALGEAEDRTTALTALATDVQDGVTRALLREQISDLMWGKVLHYTDQADRVADAVLALPAFADLLALRTRLQALVGDLDAGAHHARAHHPGPQFIALDRFRAILAAVLDPEAGR